MLARMRSAGAVVVAVLFAALLAAPASAAPLTATQILVGDHPAFVRVVVEFSGGSLTSSEVAATDPDPFPDGFVRVAMIHAGVKSTAAPVRAHGVFARVGQAGSRLTVRVTGRDRQLKYLSYVVQHSPERLVIYLYKSRPPKDASAEITTGRRSCLSLGSHKVTRTRVKASGGERNLFEHMFVVRLRRHGGGIHRQKTVTAVNGHWSTSFAYRHARRQTGTLEAVEFSAKDGALDCLVQIRVRFGGR
jgi:hypothetical protein